MIQKLIVTGLAVLIWGTGIAQQPFTLQQAIGEALKNNYQIQIARNEAEIAAQSNYAGAAGMLPNVNILANDNVSVSSIQQEFANGSAPISRDGVKSNNLNAALALNYTLFDGMKMFATRKKLDEFEKLGFQNTKNQIQNTVSNVIQAYSNVLKEQSNLALVKQTLQVSEDRMQLTKVRLTAGLANNTDIYLAQLDLDTRTQALLTQEKNVNTAYIILNAILNFKTDSVYPVDTTFIIRTDLSKESLDKALAQNPEILMASSREFIALQVQKEYQSAKYPTLRLNGQYGYQLTQSQAGFTLLNRSMGPSAGISFGMPLYTGNVNQHNINIAKLQYKNAQLYKEQTDVFIKGVYEQSWLNYTTIKIQVERDEESVKIARQYLDLMQLRYKLGQSTVLDFREAQRSFEETNARLINYKYLLKLAETDLLRLTGQLVN
jgi:outer membrane protein TolC